MTNISGIKLTRASSRLLRKVGALLIANMRDSSSRVTSNGGDILHRVARLEELSDLDFLIFREGHVWLKVGDLIAKRVSHITGILNKV